MMIKWPAARKLVRLLCGGAVAGIAMATACSAQEPFKSPSDAVTALVAAARNNDATRLRRIVGVVGRDTLSSGDDVADAAERRRFLEAFDSRHDVRENGDKATLLVGADEFPFPIPLLRSGKGWQFDGDAGRKEILARRIGRNELDAIQTSLAVLDAQRDYASKDRTGQGAGVYAQRITSRPGAKDGLYWQSAAGEEPSPLGEFAAKAAAEGYSAQDVRAPYNGYYYRILKRQGPAAPGGTIDYAAGGKMFGGFALLAYPAEYGRSGVMSFMLNHEGTVYQKDLGPRTSSVAARIQSFNPDKTWEKVTPEKP